MTKKQAIQIFSLDNNTLKFHDEPGFQFAANWAYLPVHFNEGVLLAQALPLVFRKNSLGMLELGVMLTRKGKPVIQQGRWPINVKPTLLAMYPFTWANVGGNEAQLAYYADAAHFKGPGQKLVTSKKKPTQKLRAFLTQLKKVLNAFNATNKLLQELDQLDILSDNGDYLILNKQPDQSVLEKLSPALKQLLQAHLNSLQHGTPDQAAKPKADASAQESDQKSSKAETDTVGKEKTKKKKDSTKKKAKAADSDKTAKEKKKAKNPSEKKKTKKSAKPKSVDDIINQVCDTFSVDAEALKGRKRSGNLTEARISLAEESQKADILEPMAEWLQRSPATLVSWLR